MENSGNADNHLHKIIKLQETIISLLEAEVSRLKLSQTVTISPGLGNTPYPSPSDFPYTPPYPGVIPGITTSPSGPIPNPQWYATTTSVNYLNNKNITLTGDCISTTGYIDTNLCGGTGNIDPSITSYLQANTR